MPENDQTKVCPLCAEAIKVAAKVCPHCRYLQTKWLFQVPTLRAILFTIPILALWIGAGIWIDRLVSKGRDFAEYRGSISVVESSMNYSAEQKGPMISVIGTITNNSRFSWEKIQIEAQFFDESGKLVDTISGSEYDYTILPNAERSFRLRKAADKVVSVYKSHKVFVRSASDVRTWP